MKRLFEGPPHALIIAAIIALAILCYFGAAVQRCCAADLHVYQGQTEQVSYTETDGGIEYSLSSGKVRFTLEGYRFVTIQEPENAPKVRKNETEITKRTENTKRTIERKGKKTEVVYKVRKNYKDSCDAGLKAKADTWIEFVWKIERDKGVEVKGRTGRMKGRKEHDTVS